MLSFMREQGSGHAAGSTSANRGSQGVPSPADVGPQEFLTVATTRKTLQRSTFLVVALLVVGLLCLWMMIRKVQPRAAAAQNQAEQVKIEQAIGRLTGSSTEMVGRMDAIVKKFYEFSDVFQVKVDELTKNPFEAEGGVNDSKRNTVVAEDPQLRSQLMRHQRLQQEINTLKLLCITQPGQNGSQDFYCVINDQQLRQGDKVEDFTVSRITRSSVDLVWSGSDTSGSSGSETEDIKITLKLSQ
jgi:preprotein translocase subunit SecG